MQKQLLNKKNFFRRSSLFCALRGPFASLFRSSDAFRITWSDRVSWPFQTNHVFSESRENAVTNGVTQLRIKSRNFRKITVKPLNF